jgi:putative Mg2+ transporter-C (MgtC) family protein
MESTVASTDLLLRLGIAVVFGGLLGLEREWWGKPAGLRTHMVVALGAATFTLVAGDLYRTIIEQAPEAASLDPLRIIQGIIGGIGFLGAGSIIQSRGSVEGLTTAGSLWLVGAVGVAAGGGHFAIAGAAVVLGLIVLHAVGLLEHLVRRSSKRKPEDP